MAEPDWVTVEVYNALGQRVRAAQVGYKTPGRHQYRINGAGLGAGIYFVRILAGATATGVYSVTRIR